MKPGRIILLAISSGCIGLACAEQPATTSPQAAASTNASRGSHDAGLAVNMNDLRRMPTGGSQDRDFSDAVLLAPTAHRVPGGISLGGAGANETRFSLDGATLNSPTSGINRSEIVQEYLQSPEKAR